MNQKPGLTDSVSCPTMEIPGRQNPSLLYYDWKPRPMWKMLDHWKPSDLQNPPLCDIMIGSMFDQLKAKCPSENQSVSYYHWKHRPTWKMFDQQKPSDHPNWERKDNTRYTRKKKQPE